MQTKLQDETTLLLGVETVNRQAQIGEMQQ